MEIEAGDALVSYFYRLARYSHDFLDRLPIPRRPQDIGEVLARLKPALAGQRAVAVGEIAALDRPAPPRREPRPAGMNTIGLLADRLTILCIKAWNVRQKQGDADAADRLQATHIAEIVQCLAACVPGEKDLLAKVSTLRSDLEVTSWEDAYYGLLASNILMWEAQEILYLRDLDSTPCEELRDYIRWFSSSNIQRNACISACESFFWNT